MGGGSRRLGRDKALVEWRGETLLSRAVGVLREAVAEVVVVGGREGVHGFTGSPVLADERPGLGPLGGLETALHYAVGRPVLLLACDLPRVSAGLIGLLVETARRQGGDSATAWVPRVDDALQPLCALYSAGVAEPLASFLAAGRRRAHGFAAAIDATIVDVPRGNVLYSPELFANINSATDLAELEADDPRPPRLGDE